VHRNATLTLAPSRDCVDYLTGLGVEDIRLWGRGVDVARFSPVHRSTTLHDSWSPSGRRVVGYVGRLAPEKGVEMLAGLAASPDVQVVVIGDGPCRVDLEKLMPEAHFTGRLLGHDLAEAMASLDVLVAPGELETFCQVVQEGMASGVPVVAPAIGGPRDLIDHGATGLLYEPGHRHGMERLVRLLANDRPLVSRLTAEAHAWVAGRTWGALTDELITHYEDVRLGARLAAA
jgi:phosphatidylinositol alpha 1,6-mannosyltransferase